jgi:acetyltransferase-like isoleucine patch superfamily enzyme
MIRKTLLAFAVLCPWVIRRLILRILCNATFGQRSYVGHSYIDTQKLVLGTNAQIGNLNVLRHVREIRLDEASQFGNLNWASGLSHKTGVDESGYYRSGRLIMSKGAAVTNRHYLDLHGDIELGPMSILAGVRSTVLTHSIDFATNKQVVSGIKIGDYTFIGTNAVILPGAIVAPGCVIAAGASVTGNLDRAGSLYGGVPARFLKEIPQDHEYFRRDNPFVE